MHSCLRGLMGDPPEGYEFVTSPDGAWGKLVMNPLLKSGFIYFTLQRRVLEPLFPIHLFKAYLEKFVCRPPSDAVLTYSYGHPVFRREPWVVELEWVTQLVGYRATHLSMYKRVLEKSLGSAYCKGTICWSNLCMNGLLSALNCESFHHKIHLVPHAVPKKCSIKSRDDTKVKLLFVGSANIPGEFHLKGGKEVLESFRILSAKYTNLELVVRSDVPEEIQRRYSGMPGLRLADEELPWIELEREFQTADIFLFPGHHTPFMVLLDAMSYELPIVTTDAYANEEIVANGVTGFVIPASGNVPYYVRKFIPDGRSPRFIKAIKVLDTRMVHDIADRTSILIENPELRRQMGKAGRGEVENGRFSIQNRNEKLKRVFDEAVGEA